MVSLLFYQKQKHCPFIVQYITSLTL